MLLLASEWLTTERKKQKKGEKKMSIRKWFLLMSAGLVLASCGTETEAPEETGTDDDVEEVNDTAEEEVTATFEVAIDGETLSDLTQEVTVPVGTVAMDVMHEYYDIEDDGGFITAIDGNEQDLEAERYWLYYVNDEMPSVGADQYEIEEGDRIEWRLEDSEF